ncbi:MAG: hypothetical protein WA317_18985 [Mycobacterium sp.]|uniref:hypothetical protein n=1 Tax=Mycobacterium sp. TaxID=1785 RepID=UPI003CC69921
MSWSRYEGRALADIRLQGGALFAQLEDFIRLDNPHLTDIRLERAAPTGDYDPRVDPPRRWYDVIYLADDT